MKKLILSVIVLSAFLVFSGQGCFKAQTDIATDEAIEEGYDDEAVIEELLQFEDEDEEAAPATVTTTPTPAKKPTSEVLQPPKSVVVNMTAKQWEFIPSTITANLGDTVVLNVKSVDVDHGLSLSQFGVNLLLKPGQTISTSFVVGKAGTFGFFCNVFCGEGHKGMRGTLIVNEI